jgi:hypothetical protein
MAPKRSPKSLIPMTVSMQDKSLPKCSVQYVILNSSNTPTLRYHLTGPSHIRLTSFIFVIHPSNYTIVNSRRNIYGNYTMTANHRRELLLIVLNHSILQKLMNGESGLMFLWRLFNTWLVGSQRLDFSIKIIHGILFIRFIRVNVTKQ